MNHHIFSYRDIQIMEFLHPRLVIIGERGGGRERERWPSNKPL